MSSLKLFEQVLFTNDDGYLDHQVKSNSFWVYVELQAVMDIDDGASTGQVGGGQGGDRQADPLPGVAITGQNLTPLHLLHNSPLYFRFSSSFVLHGLHQFHEGALWKWLLLKIKGSLPYSNLHFPVTEVLNLGVDVYYLPRHVARPVAGDHGWYWPWLTAQAAQFLVVTTMA